MKFISFFFIVLIAFFSCSDSSVSPIFEDEIYFPPIESTAWETISMQEAGFNEDNLQDLLNYLEEKGTKGFMILKNGKIVVENYFNGHAQNANWYWASAGKTLTSLTVGIAQQEGFLSIDDKTSDYLGNNWTSEALTDENNITIKHQLTMTTGLNDLIFSCTDPNCLLYKADAGDRWAYHNAPYTLLQSVVANATSQDFNNYFDEKVKNKIGMNGVWINSGYNHVFWSTTRSMARFGLLIFNQGIWDETTILSDSMYYQEMLNTSQNLNPSYGYLWWLNGKSSYMIPQSQESFNGMLIPSAPTDLIAGLGKNDQKLYIVPGEDLVIVRMGERAGEDDFSISDFDTVLWEKISVVINN
jgi:CubicO group peptidase (beta-lactamase class C family)